MWRGSSCSIAASICRQAAVTNRRGRSCSSAAIATEENNTPLFYEWAYQGKVISNQDPPEHAFATSSGLVLFLHGLLGNCKNLRTLVKKASEANPHLVALSMDLRGHGVSPSYTAPHTFEACAQNVQNTLVGLHNFSPPLVSIVGHSWGGRISLQLAHDIAKYSNGRLQPRAWLLDTVPGVAHSSIHHVMDAIQSIPTPMTEKRKVLEALLDQDLDTSIAHWLVASLKGNGKELNWGFDSNVVNEVLPQFETHDFYGILSDLTMTGRVDLIRSGQNEAWSQEELERLRSMGGPGFHMHVLPNAGHWVHVDDLPGLLNIFEEEELD